MFRFNDAEREAVANADAHLNNAGLPTYTNTVLHLVYLVKQANLSDLAPKNAALEKAVALLDKFKR